MHQSHAHPWQFSIDESICSFSSLPHTNSFVQKGLSFKWISWCVKFYYSWNGIKLRMCACGFFFVFFALFRCDLNKIWTIHIMLFTCYNDAVFSLYQWNLITARNEKKKTSFIVIVLKEYCFAEFLSARNLMCKHSLFLCWLFPFELVNFIQLCHQTNMYANFKLGFYVNYFFFSLVYFLNEIFFFWMALQSPNLWLNFVLDLLVFDTCITYI